MQTVLYMKILFSINAKAFLSFLKVFLPKFFVHFSFLPCSVHHPPNSCKSQFPLFIVLYLMALLLNCLSAVCKRWQMVCLDMWLCQKHLDFSSVVRLTSAAVLNMSILRSFLKRCGRNLQSLDLSYKPHNLNASVLQTVGEFQISLH